MTDGAAAEDLEPVRQTALNALMADLPANYADRYKALQRIRHAFHQAMAFVLTEPFNECVARMPQDSLPERQALTTWINQQLHDIGLAVKCPLTKRAATLLVDWQNREHPEITRFRFTIRKEDGKYIHTSSSRSLGPLELTERQPRIESLARAYREKNKSTQSR